MCRLVSLVSLQRLWGVRDKLYKSVPGERPLTAGGEAGAGWRTGDCEASQYFSPSLVGRRAWSSAASNINMQPRLDTKFEVHTDLSQPTILLQPQLAGTDQPGHIIAQRSRQPGALIMWQQTRATNNYNYKLLLRTSFYVWSLHTNLEEGAWKKLKMMWPS